ncbi:helix-turn-helix domain-containing protein [Nocardia sp. NPDC050710]|uniref:TetR/AcrR family transcriptional regulator n=1 Tax=Nocardia sp. NPDC050710 TaxID=3157220 RepID=UPI0033CCCF35
MTTEGARTSPDDSNPLGRDAVVSAVLTHAADLFAERGPAATSIRDIAERAGVNHGLVFRHLGAKDKLVTAVLDHLSAETAEFADTGTLSPDDPRLRRHWVVLARCILDGYPVGQMQSRFPVITALIDQARSHRADDRDAALSAANAAAFVLGWQLFEPFLRNAAGLDNIPNAELRQAISAEAVRILCGSPQPSPADRNH